MRIESARLMQGSSPKLPPELWAKVLGKLPQKDLLTARLVSRDFVSISLLSHLKLSAQLNSENAVNSLALFVCRHLQQRSSPELQVTIRNLDLTDVYNMPIMLACSCANLRHLKCAARLDLNDASTYLRILPSGLQSLKLHVPAELVEDTAWHRLPHLTLLELTLYARPRSKVKSSLAALSSLRTLCLNFDGCIPRRRSDGRFYKQLEIASFTHATLTGLKVNVDLFADGCKFAQSLPCLETCAVDLTDVPEGLYDTLIDRLTIMSSPGQEYHLDVQRLLCKCLTIHCSPGDLGWSLSGLLLLPLTNRFELLQRHPSSPFPSDDPIELEGTFEELKQLLEKLEANFTVPVRLRMLGHGGTVTLVNLRGNGHAVACMCPQCR